MDWLKKIRVTRENCRLEALNFCAARKMRGRPGHAEACVARPAAGPRTQWSPYLSEISPTYP